MTLRNLQFAAAIAALLGASLLTTGCGHEPTKPKTKTTLTDEAATEIANNIGDSFQRTDALQHARMWFLRYAPSPFAPGTGKAATRRAQRSGAFTEDGDVFDFEVVAYDAAGNRVPVDSTAWDQIARITMNWALRWNAVDDSTGSFWRFRSAGSYDVTGLLATQPEWSLSGAAQDSTEYRFAVQGYTSEGSWICLAGDQGVRMSKDPAVPYPLGGRESMYVDAWWATTSASGRESDHTKTTVEIEFNGTEWADMLVDGSHHFRLNLDTGDVEPIVS